MTRDESVALYERARAAEKAKTGEGAKVWNAWTEDMLAKKAELERTGQRESDQDAQNAWRKAAAANFSKHVFQDADFSGCEFPGDASFRNATFKGAARFERATFEGAAGFAKATFEGEARFGDAMFVEYAGFAHAKFVKYAGFGGATFEGYAGFEWTRFEGNAGLTRAAFKGDAWFSYAQFEGEARFKGATFQGAAWFEGARFKGNAELTSAAFKEAARFGGATFEEDARFESATFEEDADFRGAIFQAAARFDRARFEAFARFVAARFKGSARFPNATFLGGGRFDRANFEERSLFRAAKSDRGFSVDGADFREVPDFTQANFTEAPRFDDAHIRRTAPAVWGRWRRLLAHIKPRHEYNYNERQRNDDESARIRTLKVLAIRSHDHDSELAFFADEIRSYRGVRDFALPCLLNRFRFWTTVPATEANKEPIRRLIWLWQKGEFEERAKVWPGGARYWAGQVYEIFSDFGRSLVRPLFWSAVSFSAFTVAYLCRYLVATFQCHSFSGLGWAWTKLLSCIPYAGFSPPPQLFCNSSNPIVTASGMEPWPAAVYLSVRRALIFSTGHDQNKLSIAYACLYGDYSKAMQAAEQSKPVFRVLPHIPDAVSALAIIQSLLSAALIFLFLLAVRNQFRIK